MSTKIKRKNITFIDRIADVFIVLEWLRQHYLNVGSEIYNKSLPVKELHGTGFFGVNNEVFAGPANVRWTTDILGFKQDRIQHIYFRSESWTSLILEPIVNSKTTKKVIATIIVLTKKVFIYQFLLYTVFIIFPSIIKL